MMSALAKPMPDPSHVSTAAHLGEHRLTQPGAHVLLPGQIVGSYRILGSLGRGGMSEVFWAVHRDLERQAAIKVLYPEMAHLSAQLLHEGRVVNRVAHPGLVEVYECGTLPDGAPYIVMELLRGRTLGRYLHEQAPVSLALTLHLFEQVAEAMAAAHRKGVIHRDLKPDNVMVVSDGERGDAPRIKILDFGLAKLVDRPSALSGNGTTLGTPEYMAPEQCMGATNVDGQVDVYSLGVMLYEVLAGHLPFSGQSTSEIMTLHVSAEVPPLPRPRDGAQWPPGLVSLLERMLAKDPLGRPQMDDVARDLAFLRREQGPATVELAAPRSRGSLGRARFTDQHPTLPYGPAMLEDLLSVLRFLLSHPAAPAGPDEAAAPR
jgi:serine/threonine-protein kinase